MGRGITHEARLLLPDALRWPVVIISALAALAVLTMALAVAGDVSPTSFDREVVSLTAARTTAETRWALVLDSAGEPKGLALLVALLFTASLLLRRPRVALLVVLGTGLTISVTSALKPLVGRTIHHVYLSYPSGHTASATAMAMTAALLVSHRLGRRAALALLYGVATVAGTAAGWAQSSLMAHYPSDTVAGWCTALAVIPTTAWLVDGAAERWRPGRAAEWPRGVGDA